MIYIKSREGLYLSNYKVFMTDMAFQDTEIEQAELAIAGAELFLASGSDPRR